MSIQINRIYDDPSDDDGTRVLVDRLWPRGASKEDAQLDRWLQDLAPSDELRQWFDHDPEKWVAFKHRYQAELAEKDELVAELQELAEEDTVTLLYAATDREHNNAVALKEFLDQRIDSDTT